MRGLRATLATWRKRRKEQDAQRANDTLAFQLEDAEDQWNRCRSQFQRAILLTDFYDGDCQKASVNSNRLWGSFTQEEHLRLVTIMEKFKALWMPRP